MENNKRMQLYLTPELKENLEKMSKEVGLSQNNLAVLALHGLVKNYESNGTLIFSELLSNKKK